MPDSELEADALLRRLTGPGPQWSAVVAGEEGTRSCVQGVLDRATAGRHDAFVLFGTFHDAPGQIDAFRWLIGPGGLRHLTAVAAEQFRATGAWRGVPPEAQRGDDADIAAYLEHGERGAFERLAERHRESDYAAWKLGYEPSVLELLVTARADERGAHGARFTGCDMPTRTQELVAALPDEARRRLREIDCLMALAALDEPARATRGASKSGASPRPAARVATIWGQAHVQSIRRFLPPSADVLSLYVFGYRPGDETTEAKLARHLALVDPVIVPLNARGDVAALLYPDAVLGASVDCVRERADDAGGANVPPLHDAGGRVVFALAGPTRGRLVVGERAIDLVPAPGLAMAGVTLDLPPATTCTCWRSATCASWARRASRAEGISPSRSTRRTGASRTPRPRGQARGAPGSRTPVHGKHVRGPRMVLPHSALALLVVSLGVAAPRAARAESSLLASAQALAHDLGPREQDERVLVVASPLTSDVAAPRGEDLAARMASLVAAALGDRATGEAHTMSLASARARTHAGAGKLTALVYVDVRVEAGELRLTADRYPVVANGWDRIRSSPPAPAAHAYLHAPVAAEVRSYLVPVHLERARVTKYAHDAGPVLAIACGDLDGAGGNNLVLVSQREVVWGYLRDGRFVAVRRAPASSLGRRLPVPWKEPLATAASAPADGPGTLFVGWSDRAGAAVGADLVPRLPLRGLPVWTGTSVACVVPSAARAGFDEALVACEDGRPLRESSQLAAAGAPLLVDAWAALELVGVDGRPSRVVAAREPSGTLHLARAGTAETATLDDVGAQVALGDLDQDGAPEVITTTAVTATPGSGEDALVILELARREARAEGAVGSSGRSGRRRGVSRGGRRRAVGGRGSRSGDLACPLTRRRSARRAGRR